MLKKMKIDVETEHGLDDDQRRRVAEMVTGNGHIDHQGGYVDAAGIARTAARIHFTSETARYDGVPGSQTNIDGIDGKTFGKPIHVIIEGTDGTMTGIREARCLIRAGWHYGVIFMVDDEVWFAGHDTVPNDGMSADAPVLKRVEAMASERPGAEPFLLTESLPSEGEFWLTAEDKPHVVSIPWMSGYGGEPDAGARPDTVETFAKERTIHEALIQRVRDLDMAPSL